MRLPDYFGVLKKHLILLLVAVIAGAGMGAGYCFTQAPMYESTSRAWVSTREASNVADLSTGAYFTQQVAKSYADLATSTYVLRSVIATLGLHATSQELASRVSAMAVSDSVVLEITASDRSPVQAARIADAIVDQLSTAVSSLTAEVASTRTPVQITLIEPAVPAVRPSSPHWALDMALGALALLSLAVAVAVLRTALDTRVQNAAQLKAITRRPLLAVIRRRNAGGPAVGVLTAGTDDPRAEAFRTLRTNLEFVEFGRGGRSMVITSAVPGEGKSTVAVNLAVALAQAGQSVVLIDADLRRPTVATYLGIDGSVGLTDVLIGKVSVADALQTWGNHGLAVIPAGRRAPNPSELLQTHALVDLLAELGDRYSMVLVDAPPVLAVSDALVLARRTAGTVLVAAVGAVRRPQVLEALDALKQVEATVFGVVAVGEPARAGEVDIYGYQPVDEPTDQRVARRRQRHAGTTAAARTPSYETPPALSTLLDRR